LIILLYSLNTTSPRQYDNVCGFLDAYFAADELVESAPNVAHEKHLRKKWTELYREDYVPWCKYNELKSVPVNIFTSIRKHFRPKFKKSQKMRKRGFDMTSCSRCETYNADIDAATDPEVRSELVNSFEFHKRLARGARRHYANHRAKATLPINSNVDMDMAIDASGGSGTVNLPRYQAAGKDDPPQQDLLDIKCTFTKIHGLGTKVYISFPTLESQGGNLTVEVNCYCNYLN
jgi:hypothetical protein